MFYGKDCPPASLLACAGCCVLHTTQSSQPSKLHDNCQCNDFAASASGGPYSSLPLLSIAAGSSHHISDTSETWDTMVELDVFDGCERISLSGTKC